MNNDTQWIALLKEARDDLSTIRDSSGSIYYIDDMSRAKRKIGQVIELFEAIDTGDCMKAYKAFRGARALSRIAPYEAFKEGIVYERQQSAKQPAENAESAFQLAQLRHLYAQMRNGSMKDPAVAAYGLLGPAIAHFERGVTACSPAEKSQSDGPFLCLGCRKELADDSPAYYCHDCAKPDAPSGSLKSATPKSADTLAADAQEAFAKHWDDAGPITASSSEIRCADAAFMAGVKWQEQQTSARLHAYAHAIDEIADAVDAPTGSEPRQVADIVEARLKEAEATGYAKAKAEVWNFWYTAEPNAKAERMLDEWLNKAPYQLDYITPAAEQAVAKERRELLGIMQEGCGSIAEWVLAIRECGLTGTADCIDKLHARLTQPSNLSGEAK